MAHSDSHADWQQFEEKFIYPAKSTEHPYYISAPRYTHTSAGIRALYLLCHSLRRIGHEAYITNLPWDEYLLPWGECKGSWTTPELMAPMLTNRVTEYHFKEKRTPVVIYPETVKGNPMQAPVVARWVLNFPGLLGGDNHYPGDELVFGFSSELATAGGAPANILHMPTVDTRVYYPAETDVKRSGCCFFASKYRNVHKATPGPITEHCFEITRNRPDSLAPKELAELLRSAEIFYTYENTALATEAVICGCPAVFIPNPHLEKIIAREELGQEGYAWGTDPAEIERAKATVDQGIRNYLKTYDTFWKQLEHFVQITQAQAALTPYKDPITVPGARTTWQVVHLGIKRQGQRITREYRRFVRKLWKFTSIFRHE